MANERDNLNGIHGPGKVVCAETFQPGMTMLDGSVPESRAMSIEQWAQVYRSGRDIDGSASGLVSPGDPYTGNLWAFKCISKRQSAVKGVPLRFSRKATVQRARAQTRTFGRDRKVAAANSLRAMPGCRHVLQGRAAEGELVETGEVADLFARPNSIQQSLAQFLEALIGCYDRSGSVAIVKGDTDGRRAGSLHILDGAAIQPHVAVDDTGLPMLLGYVYTTAKGRKIPLTADDVQYLFRWHPTHMMAGLKPSEPGRLTLATDYSAALFNAVALSNHGEPGAVISVPGTLTDPQRAEMIDSWNARHAGPARAKRAALIEGGAKVEAYASSFPDLQFDEGTRRTRLEICALFDVPPAVAGWIDATGDSSAYVREAQEMFWGDTVLPLLDMIAPAIQAIVDAIDNTLEAWFDVEDQPVMQRQRQARVSTATDFFAMGVPMADINGVLDLGLPERPWYQVGMLPMGLAPAADVAANAPLADEPAADEAGDDDEPTDEIGQPADEEAIGDRGTRVAEPGAEKLSPGQPSEAELVRLWRSQTRSWSALSGRYRSALRGVFARQQQAAVKALRRHLANHSANHSANSNRQSAGAEKRDDGAIVLRIIFDVVAENKRLRVRAQAFAADAAEVGLRQSYAAVGLTSEALETAVKTALTSPRFTRLIVARAWRATTLTNNRTARMLQRQLADGLSAGESVNQVADRVMSVFKTRRGAARVIAQNASGQVYSQARHEGRKLAGVPLKAWVHSRGGGNRRANHVAAEATYAAHPIPVGQPFAIGSARLMHPRDFAAHAPAETINCQCIAVGRMIGQTPRDAVAAETRAAETWTYAAVLTARRTNEQPKPSEDE